MTQYESPDRTLARRRKMAAKYPEISTTAPDTVLKVDAFTSARGRLPSTLTQDMVASANHYRRGADIEDVLAAEDSRSPASRRLSGDISPFGSDFPNGLPKPDAGPPEDEGGGFLGGVKNLLLSPFQMGGISAGAPIPSEAGTAPTLVERAEGNLTNADRVTGAPIRGVLLHPSTPVRGVIEAVKNPQQAQLRNLGGIRSLPDEDVVGSLSVRDIAGGAADAIADVGTVYSVAKAPARAISQGVRGFSDDLAESAIREAEGPLETITRGAIRNEPVIPGETPKGRARVSGGADVPEQADLLVPNDPVQTLITRISDAKPLQEQNKELLSQFRSRQAGAFQGAVKGGEAGFNRGLGAMRGQTDRVGFTPLRDAIGQEGVDELFTRLGEAHLRPFEHASAGTALRNIVDGVVPTPSELAELEKAFPGVTEALEKANIVKGPGWKEEVRDFLSLPQSLKSSFDLSGLRQVATAAYGHPRMFGRNFVQSLKAAQKEENFRGIMDDLNNRWYRPLREDAGVAIQEGEQALSPKERTFVSRILNASPKVAGVRIPNPYRGSQRAYTALLDTMRDDLFADMLKHYGGSPSSIPESELKRWGRLINASTGRGELPSFLKSTKVANAPLFWAPRLIASRIQLPFLLASKSPQVRREAARQLAAFIGVNTAIIGLGAQAGLWEVETNPTSADFMQIKIGNQRIDPWAGFRPVVNLVARELTGERKSTTSGQVSSLDRKDALADFGRQKFSPLVATIVNLWTGEDAIGQPYEVGDVPADLFAPLGVQETTQAATSYGPREAAGSLLGAVGLGVNTYGGKPEDEFWGIGADTWNTLEKQPTLKALVGDEKNYGDWYSDTREKVIGQMRGAGMTPAQAATEADRAMQSHPVVQAYNELRDILRQRFIAEHPEVAVALWDRESQSDDPRWNPTKAQMDMMNEWLAAQGED